MAKTFRLSDESLNSRGYWVKTSGISLSSFKKNPVMLWNHSRSWQDSNNTILPIGHWENIRVEGDQLYGDAVFDMNDEFAAKIAKKVEQGDLSGCSIGIEVLKMSEDPTDLKPGQTRYTVTKCTLLEASICDIPANANAVALYQNGNIVELSADGRDFPVRLLTNKKTMKMNENLKVIAVKLGLPDNADEAGILASISQLMADMNGLKDAKLTLEQRVAAFEREQGEAVKREAEELGAQGLKLGKFEAGGKDAFVTMYKANPVEGRKFYDSLPARRSLAAMVNGGNSDSKYAAMSWDQLDRAGMLEALKREDTGTFKQKFLEKFGKEPENV